MTESIVNDQPQRSYTEYTGAIGSNRLRLPKPGSDGNTIGLIHNHWADDGKGRSLSPIFSLRDFLYFCEMAGRRQKSGKDMSVLTFIVVSHTGKCLCFKATS